MFKSSARKAAGIEAALTTPCQRRSVRSALGLDGLFFACDPSGEVEPLVGVISEDIFADQWPDSLIVYETHSEGMTPAPSGGALVKVVSVDEFAPFDLVGSGNHVE